MSQSQEDIVVQFSARLAEAVRDKVEIHNRDCASNKVTFSQIIKVYKHGAQNFPMEALSEVGINKWSLARVNMYLRIKRGDINLDSIGSLSNIRKEMSSLVFENEASKRVNSFLDVTENWVPNEEDFSLAQEYVVKYDLNYDFNNLDEIYLVEEGQSEGLSFE
jgi:hypothetical protein